jgi:hypothetical protein
MQSGPIRSKLIAVPVAALLVLGAVPAVFIVAPRHALAAGVVAWVLGLAMAGAAFASAVKVARRVRTLRASLAPIADPDGAPQAGSG